MSQRGVTPQRIQRRRTRGWRMPEDAVYVGRPTKWGNPYRLADWSAGYTIVGPFGHEYSIAPDQDWRPVAVRHFREDLADGRLDFSIEAVEEELAGRDLVCWCPLDQPCHADVLLEIANSRRE